jgi:hypothetical protein
MNRAAYRLHTQRLADFQQTNSGDLKNMRNIIRTALIVGTLATPMIAMADTPAKKDAPAAKDTTKTDAKASDTKDATTKDTKKTDAKKTDAKKTDTKTDTKTDAKKTDTK